MREREERVIVLLKVVLNIVTNWGDGKTISELEEVKENADYVRGVIRSGNPSPDFQLEALPILDQIEAEVYRQRGGTA